MLRAWPRGSALLLVLVEPVMSVCDLGVVRASGWETCGGRVDVRPALDARGRASDRPPVSTVKRFPDEDPPVLEAGVLAVALDALARRGFEGADSVRSSALGSTGRVLAAAAVALRSALTRALSRWRRRSASVILRLSSSSLRRSMLSRLSPSRMPSSVIWRANSCISWSRLSELELDELMIDRIDDWWPMCTAAEREGLAVVLGW